MKVSDKFHLLIFMVMSCRVQGAWYAVGALAGRLLYALSPVLALCVIDMVCHSVPSPGLELYPHTAWL